MSSSVANLIIKTEGVTESYKDIGNLLGPLQGINTMLYQLNKTLGIVDKQSTSNGKSLSALAREGNATAKSQLDLQKQLRNTAKEAVKAAKEQADSGAKTVTLLKSLNIMAALHGAVEIGKKLADGAKKIAEFGIEALNTYYEQTEATNKQMESFNQIKTAVTAVKVGIGRIISQKLDSYLQAGVKPVELVSSAVRGIASGVNHVVYFLKQAKNAVELVADFILQGLTNPINAIMTALGNGLKMAAKLPLLSEETASNMDRVADTLYAFATMNLDAAKGDIEDMKKNSKDFADNEAKIAELFSPANLQADMDIVEQHQANITKETEKQRDAVKEVAKAEEDLAQKGLIAHNTKMDQIQQELSSKLNALDEYDGDAKIKEELELGYIRQALDAEKAERLRYAQETNDQKTIIDENYRAAKAAAEDAAHAAELTKMQETEDKIKAQEQQWKDLAKSLKTELAQGALGAVGNSATDLFDSMIEGEELTREGAYDMFRSLAKNIYNVGIQSLLKTVGELIMNAGNSAAQTPIVGPIIAAAAMATMGGITAGLMAKYKPKQAQVSYANGGYISAGLVRGGIANTDSVTASLMPGERVLSKAEAEEYDKEEPSSTPTVINININGQFNTPTALREAVRTQIIPELRSALKAGYSF